MRTFTKTAIKTAAVSFGSATLLAGLILLGNLGANAAESNACHINSSTSKTDAYGNHVLTWGANGDCAGVTVSLVSTDAKGSEVLQKDPLSPSLTASFTYGVVEAGTTYTFEVSGKTAATEKPIILKTVSGN